MILELLGLGMLGAIGKTVYDEAKKEQSSNNTNQSTTNKNYTDDSRYWNLIYSYARMQISDKRSPFLASAV